jgi:hypothetical protein
MRMKRRAIIPWMALSTTLLITLIHPQQAFAQNLDLNLLPDGNYFFKGPPSPDLNGEPITILFQKRSNVVTGIGIAFMSENHCFKGHLKANTIEKVMLAIPDYSERPKSPSWKITQGPRPISLASYRRSKYEEAPKKSVELMNECLKILANQ